MRRTNVASTSFRRHMPTRFLINQCQIITFLIWKSDIIDNSRIEMRRIVLPVPSNQIKVTFIIILPFNLVYLWFFPVSHRNWRKRWVDYCRGRGGGQRVCCPLPSQIIGGGVWTPLFLRLCYQGGKIWDASSEDTGVEYWKVKSSTQDFSNTDISKYWSATYTKNPARCFYHLTVTVSLFSDF